MLKPKKQKKISHKQLVIAARNWLTRKCSIVITELAAGAGEEPDAIGWESHRSTLVECKISRSDFLADQKKYFRALIPGIGLQRYFLTPPDLLKPEELPEGWGLIELHGRQIKPIKTSIIFPHRNHQHEFSLLLSCLRRIGQKAPKGVSIKAYTYETKNRATLSTEKEQTEDFTI